MHFNIFIFTGYHQKCHEPFIKDNALEPEAPWMCVYCTNGSECPYLLNPFEAKVKNFTRSSRKHRTVGKVRFLVYIQILYVLRTNPGVIEFNSIACLFRKM